MLFMAWSPVRRTNAGRFEVDHPGDYATLNSYQPSDGTLANGISKTEAAIRRCREIPDDLQEPKTVGMQAVVKAIRDLLPKLEV
jgi:hypothetical protein